MLKCSLGSVRMAVKICCRSSVPTTSGPRLRYSSASFSICASPMSWISWADFVVVVKWRRVAAYASSPSGSQLRPHLLVRAAEREDLVAQHVAVGPHARAYVGLDHRAEPGLPAVDVESRRAATSWTSSGSSAIGLDSRPSSWATVSAAANAAGRRPAATPSRWRSASSP